MRVFFTILILIIAAGIAAGIVCFLRTLMKPVKKSDYKPVSFRQNGSL